MIAVTKYPTADVNSNSATQSRWSAVHHPIKFNIQRRDFEIVASANITGGLVVYTGNTSEVTVGASVYISSGANKGVGVVTSIVANNSFECSFSNASTIVQSGGYYNVTARKNYYCITRVLGVDASNQYYIVGESYNKPDETGLMKVDCSSWLKSLIGYTDEFDYDQLNWRDSNLGGRFNIVFAEFWTGTDGVFSEPSASELFYFTNSTRQVRDLYGSNMGEFVVFKDYDGETTLAKFMCDFKRPTYFVGFPFSTEFIYSESIANVVVKKFEKQIDQNGNEITTTNDQLDGEQCLGVNRLMLNESYPSNCKKIQMWLETDQTLLLLDYVLSDFVVSDYIDEESTTPDVVIPSVITAGK